MDKTILVFYKVVIGIVLVVNIILTLLLVSSCLTPPVTEVDILTAISSVGVAVILSYVVIIDLINRRKKYESERK